VKINAHVGTLTGGGGTLVVGQDAQLTLNLHAQRAVSGSLDVAAGASVKATVRQTEVRVVETRQADAKQVETRQADSRQLEVRQAEAARVQARQAEIQEVEAKQAAVRGADAKPEAVERGADRRARRAVESERQIERQKDDRFEDARSLRGRLLQDLLDQTVRAQAQDRDRRAEPARGERPAAGAPRRDAPEAPSEE
jgi:hypothetical protein